MRKILISILIALLLVAGYLVTFKGLNVLGLDVLSFEQIKEKNEGLDKKLQQVSTLTSVEQPRAIQELQDSAKQLTIAKEEYNDKVIYSSSENIVAAGQVRPYETEYLWTRLGNHAKKNTINLRYELKQASSGVSGLYDIYFTVTGSYVSISEFVASLENDSSLKFKIENFKLNPSTDSNEILQATFYVREINVKVDNMNPEPSSPTNTNVDTTMEATAEKNANDDMR